MELWAHTFLFLSQILVYSLEAGRRLLKLGNVLRDFTCVNLSDSPPNLMVSGNMDGRYVNWKGIALQPHGFSQGLATRPPLRCSHCPVLIQQLCPPEFSPDPINTLDSENKVLY